MLRLCRGLQGTGWSWLASEEGFAHLRVYERQQHLQKGSITDQAGAGEDVPTPVDIGGSDRPLKVNEDVVPGEAMPGREEVGVDFPRLLPKQYALTRQPSTQFSTSLAMPSNELWRRSNSTV